MNGSGQATRLQVLIPVKGLDAAKTRLAGVLDAGQRRALMLALIEDVVAVVRAASTDSRIALATSDPVARKLAERLGIAVADDGGLAWNSGLQHALGALAPGAPAVLFLSADLPALTPADVAALVDACPRPGAAIARAHDGGTNALLLSPPDLIVPAFGEGGSCAVHAGRVADAGAHAVIVDRPGLALDLDGPADLAAALAAAPSGRSWRAVVATP